MRNYVRAAVLAALAAGLAAAQAKIGVIDSQRAIAGTAEVKKAQADLEAKFKPRNDQMVKLQQDLAGIQAQIQSGKLSQQGIEDLNAEGTRKQRELQRREQDLREDVDRERQEVLGKVRVHLNDVVKQVATQKGLDAVFDSSTMVFFKPALDITDESLAAYDKTYPVK